MAIWQGSQQLQGSRAENNFSGGLNVGVPSIEVQNNQFTDGYGWNTDKFPALHTRNGKTNYGASGPSRVNLLTSYGTKHLFRAVGASLEYDNLGTWTNVANLNVGTDMDATNFNNKLLITNGSDPVKVWDGTAISDLSANAPTGKYITNDTIRVWIAKGDILYYSAFLNETDWTTPENSGSVQYYTPSGGDITGLTNFANHICVFKRNSFAEIFGTNYYNFRLVENSNQIGCVAYKTLQEVQDTLFWLGETDVYRYQGGKPIPIGQPIRKYLDAINKPLAYKCMAATDGVKYYLGLVTGTGNDVNVWLFYDTRYNIWGVSSLNDRYTYATLFNNEWYTGDETGQVYKMSGTTDNGTAISYSVSSKAFDEGIPEAEKEYYELHIQAYLPTGSTMTVAVSTRDRDLGDGFDFTDIFTATSDSVAQGMNIIVPLDTVPITKWFRYKIYGTGEVEIHNVERYFRVHPVQH